MPPHSFISNHPNTKTENQSPKLEVIYAYTRKQAVADGVQVEVTKTAQEAGIKFPVFLTRTVFDAFVAVPEGVTGQDEAGRLWDIVWMLRFGINSQPPGQPLAPLPCMSATTTAPPPHQIDCPMRPPRH
jgi:hypothetical protein